MHALYDANWHNVCILHIDGKNKVMDTYFSGHMIGITTRDHPTNSLIKEAIKQATDSPTLSSTHSLTHSHARSVFHSLSHHHNKSGAAFEYSLPHSLTRSLTHSLTHLLTPSLIINPPANQPPANHRIVATLGAKARETPEPRLQT